jgi:hypothetical protein
LFSFIPFENSPVGIWFKAVSQYLSPLERHATPTSNQQIMARLNEITFNSPLKGELRAIEFIAQLIDQGRLPRGIGPGKYRRIYMHRIALEDSAKALNSQSQLNTDYDFQCCVIAVAAQRTASWTPISMTSACVAPSIWRKRYKPSGHKVFSFCAGVRFTSDRCGSGDGIPPRELTYPTERLEVQSAWTVLALAARSGPRFCFHLQHQSMQRPVRSTH